MNDKKYFSIISQIRGDICSQSSTFRVLSAESQIIFLNYTIFLNVFYQI